MYIILYQLLCIVFIITVGIITHCYILLMIDIIIYCYILLCIVVDRCRYTLLHIVRSVIVDH